jgi:hypothetical protein
VKIPSDKLTILANVRNVRNDSAGKKAASLHRTGGCLKSKDYPTGLNKFDPLDVIAVDDDRTLLGYVHEDGNEWIAFSHHQRRIGSFSSRKLATRAAVDRYSLDMGRA